MSRLCCIAGLATVCCGHPNRHDVQLQMTSHALSASATEQVVHECQPVQHRQGGSPFVTVGVWVGWGGVGWGASRTPSVWGQEGERGAHLLRLGREG